MSNESKPTLDAIYAAWRAVGADVAGLDWAKFVGHIAAQAPAEGDATLTEEQIDRFIPERIGVRNWGKPEQADLFNRGQVRDAIRTAIGMAEDGDIILFAGKGHEDYQLIEGKKVHFVEREIIQEICREKQ